MTVPVRDPSAFEQNVAAFRALRERYTNDIFIHESYQDAVQRYGIEGQLRALTDEYQSLAAEHPGDLFYRYLYARSLIGRGTASAMQEMTSIVDDHSGFAPGHRMLAEIYATEAFRDAEKEDREKKSFLTLCPGTEPAQYPAPLPEPSRLIDQAERLLDQDKNGDPEHASALALQGLQENEWRLQRIRPFDWYSADFKRRNQRELQAEYWRVWSVQVRCYRRAGKPDKAAMLLVTMEQRAAQLRVESGTSYWEALVILGHLYSEGNQKEQAEQTISQMRKLLMVHPDPDRRLQVEELGKSIEACQPNAGPQATAKTGRQRF